MIIIIDHYSQAPGEKGNNRFLFIADMLCTQGHEVEIVTSNFSHIRKKHRKIENSELQKLKYKYTMLHEPGYKKNISLTRIYSHFIFGENLKKYLSLRENVECIYISVPSLDVGKVAANYSKTKGIPFIVDIQDIWPEAFELVLPLKSITKYLLVPLYFMANHIYRSADYIFAVSETYLQRGLRVKSSARGSYVYLGTDLDLFDNAVKESNIYKNDDEIWIVYVGTLGASYNIELVINAIKALFKLGRLNIRLKILGDGPDLNYLKSISRNTPVDFLGRLDYKEMVGYLAKCDIAVNVIVKNAAQSIINKHADYAAAGLPIISTQESSEYKNLLKKYNCGINCEVDDINSFIKAIEFLIDNSVVRIEMGSNSRKMAEELFNRRNTNKEIIDIVERIIKNENNNIW